MGNGLITGDVRRLASALALAAGMALTFAPAARAEQVTLGPGSLAALTPLSFGAPNCVGGPCTGYQDPLRGGQGPRWTSPVNGIVSSWSIRVSATAQSDQTGAANRYRLRILRVARGESADFVAVRSTTALTPIFSAPGIYAQPAGLPISVGEQVALGGISGAELPNFLASSSIPHVRYTAGGNDPPDGQVGQAFNSDNTSLLGISATVEFCRVPDVKGKKLKKAKRRVRRAGCDPKPKAKGKAKNRKKRKRVRKQRPAAGITVAPGTQVKLVYRR